MHPRRRRQALSHPAAMFLTSERGGAWPQLALGFLALFSACTKEGSDTPQASSSVVPKASVVPRAPIQSRASTRAPGTGPFGCHLLLPKAQRAPQGPETIRLQPPDPAGKTIVLNKTGVIATFSRDEFLITARCLGIKEAVANLEAETGHTKESPLRDAFGLSYVAAALLDVGRVGVRLRNETESRRTIVRDAWSREGCDGKCVSFGRVYQLTDADPFPFFSVSDRASPP